MTTAELDMALTNLIKSQGGTLSASAVLEAAATVWREVRAEMEPGEERLSVFNFIIAEDVAVFTVLDEHFDLYVVRLPLIDDEIPDEWSLINRFEQLAMSEVAEARDILRTDYGKDRPDMSISLKDAAVWLGVSQQM